MSVVRFSRQAEADLTEIWVYIAQDNVDAADRLIDRIYDTCHHTLAPSPQGGRARPELAEALRSYPIGHYVIFYRPICGCDPGTAATGIEVVRILSGHRDVSSLLGD